MLNQNLTISEALRQVELVFGDNQSNQPFFPLNISSTCHYRLDMNAISVYMRFTPANSEDAIYETA